jgi:hypothetical protein
MRLPVDTSRLTVLIIGDPVPATVYGTDTPRTTADGRPLFKVPVLLSGTGERTDPTTVLTVPGPLATLEKSVPCRVDGLTISTWTMRGQDGRERSGVTLRADSVDTPVVKPLRP